MRSRTRKPAAVRREEIARAVLTILGTKGLPSLTASRLAEEVGVSSGALFRHFESLDAMLLEAVRHAIVQIEGTFPDPSLPARERLFRLAAARVSLLGSDPGLAWLLRSEQAPLSLPGEAVDQLRELAVRSRAYLLSAIREGLEEKSLRSDIDPEALLVIVMGTVHALVGMPGVHGPPRGRREAGPAKILTALERLLAPPRRAPSS